ncbi:MAG: DUF6569 family protein [Myxococcota bacterium]
MRLTVEDILRGTRTGRRQSVGVMEVIPLLGEDDETFAPPHVEVGTSHYGTVDLRNDDDRPTIVPPGAGWVVRQAAQDHAIGSGKLMRAGQSVKIDTARCIQQSQGGYIGRDKHPMVVLPAALRGRALAMRNETGYDKLWPDITRFNTRLGASTGGGGGHLEYFLRHFAKQLDEFVAEFELVPDQRGAIILIGGRVVGVELAPNQAFWRHVWEPLVRVCYGSLAIEVARALGERASVARPLRVIDDRLEGLEAALAEATSRERADVEAVVRRLAGLVLSQGAVDDQLGRWRARIVLTTVASPELAGQVARRGDEVRYASLCAAGA